MLKGWESLWLYPDRFSHIIYGDEVMSARKGYTPYIRGTYHITMAGGETEPIRDLIQRRRHQLVIHSCIYYRLNDNLISDKQWDSWAKELVQLQKDYPTIAERVDYHKEFMGFDGSTGFDLPINNPEIISKAQWLLNYHKEVIKNGNKEGSKKGKESSKKGKESSKKGTALQGRKR